MQEEKNKRPVTIDIQKRNSTIIGINGEILFQEEGDKDEVKRKQSSFLRQRN